VHDSYPSERLVYLSPNADKILTEFNEQNIYVIGGLVDESVRKVFIHFSYTSFFNLIYRI